MSEEVVLQGCTYCRGVNGILTVMCSFSQGMADRVSLGLLPSSQGGWQTALEALKPDLGGWLHLHHNVTNAAQAEWCQQTVAALQLLADQVLGRSWICR